jgi:TRAP-type C4-dicarboxylate transport system substrate-binding protein
MMRAGTAVMGEEARMSKSKHVVMLATLTTAVLAGSVVAAPTAFCASHQFPGGKSDVREEMVQIITRDAKAASVHLEVQVCPGASLFKLNEQWNALLNSQLDISSFPLAYTSGKEGVFGATLMLALVRSHKRALRLNDSKFMKEISKALDDEMVKVFKDQILAS